jgi:hypothetical protein
VSFPVGITSRLSGLSEPELTVLATPKVGASDDLSRRPQAGRAEERASVKWLRKTGWDSTFGPVIVLDN